VTAYCGPLFKGRKGRRSYDDEDRWRDSDGTIVGGKDDAVPGRALLMQHGAGRAQE